MSYNPNSGISDKTFEGIANTSGLTIIKATPIRIDGDGNINNIDVSSETEALSVAGVSLENIVDGTRGDVVTSGRVEDIVTTANNGDVLYVSKTGALTNIKPDIGIGGFVSGDFVIRIGVVYKNQYDPIKQDLLLNIDVVGQL